MSQMHPYVIRQGDHLLRLATANRFDADVVWNDPANADLKKLRTTYNVLLPGDVIRLPKSDPKWLALKVGAENKFVATLTTCTIAHAFLNGDDGDSPLANLSYRVIGTGLPDGPPLTTDGNGTATFDVAAYVDMVRVVFDSGLAFDLRVGHLDPASSPTGCDQRLIQLGYIDAPGEADDPAQAASRSQWVALALAAFQTDNGLPSTGKLDDATAGKLVQAFGC
jgi:hypothetical protein